MTALDLGAQLGYQGERREPLRRFRWRNPVMRRLAEHLGRLEVYLHGGNSCGKTYQSAAIVVALLRGWTELDGVPLPKLHRPTTGIVIVPSYRQAAGATVAAIRELLGGHAFVEVSAGGPDSTAMLFVKPDDCTSDNHKRDWSRLYVFTAEGEGPAGFRADFAWADEPPPMWLWEECLFRMRANSPFLAWITATPLEPKMWRPLLERFADCLNVPRGGRLRLQASVHDNAALSVADVERAEMKAVGSVFERARLDGEHVNATGSCPFDPRLLNRWRARTRPADETVHMVARRQNDTGEVLAPVTVQFECWADADEREQYVICADPASGLANGDPDGLHVYALRSRKLVGRLSGRVGAWALGLLAAKVSEAFNDAELEVFSTGGWAAACYAALRSVDFERFLRLPASVPGTRSGGRVGFVETQSTREQMIAALQGALAADSLIVHSAAVVDCLESCIITEKGKIEAGPGGHDEDLVLCARGAQLVEYLGAQLTEPYQDTESSARRAFERAKAADAGFAQESARGGDEYLVDHGADWRH